MHVLEFEKSRLIISEITRNTDSKCILHIHVITANIKSIIFGFHDVWSINALFRAAMTDELSSVYTTSFLACIL